MSSHENLDFPIAVTKRFIKEHVNQDMQLPLQFTKSFAKALRVFVHYLATISDDIAAERRKGILGPNEVEAAIKEIGFENLLNAIGKLPTTAETEAPKQKKPKRKREQMEKTQSAQTTQQTIEEENPIVETFEDQEANNKEAEVQQNDELEVEPQIMEIAYTK